MPILGGVDLSSGSLESLSARKMVLPRHRLSTGPGCLSRHQLRLGTAQQRCARVGRAADTAVGFHQLLVNYYLHRNSPPPKTQESLCYPCKEEFFFFFFGGGGGGLKQFVVKIAGAPALLAIAAPTHVKDMRAVDCCMQRSEARERGEREQNAQCCEGFQVAVLTVPAFEYCALTLLKPEP